ncbi:MAG: DUF4013 domain-containing protein [Deferribacteres bacterium]|nr:DUF4013 domain-containing protein [candidate division KSB1 bacterium]MCB9503779.1 DUF4013 domain-containing protein [Deferribacteres bacterium]
MNFAEALSFTFEDREWAKKLLIGGALNWVGMFLGLFFITGFFTLGYFLLVVSNVHKQQKPELPDWKTLSPIFVDGLVGAIIMLLYIIIVAMVIVPIIIHFATNDYISDLTKGFSIASVAIFGVLALAVLSNLGLIVWAITKDFTKAMNPLTVIGLLRNKIGLLLGILIFTFILSAILFLGGLGIISPFFLFWGSVVQAHLFGQLARDSIMEESPTINPGPVQ